jgi:hypothetical protein
MKGQRKRKRTTEDEYDSSDLDGSKDEKDDSSSDDEERDNPGERTEDKTKVDDMDTEDDHIQYLRQVATNAHYGKLLACLVRLPVGAVFTVISVYYY